MKLKKVLIIIISFIWLGAGLAAGIWLVREKQLLGKKASVPGGTATVRFDPATAAKNSGEVLAVQIPFDTAGAAISGITVKINLTDGGGAIPFRVIGVQPNSVLAADGLDYRVATFTDLSVDIYAVTLEEGGFTPSGEVSLATVSLMAQAAGTTTASFDPVRSMITQAGPGGDILLTPLSTGTYTVSGEELPTPTNTPMPTLTPTPTPTLPGGGVEPTSTPTITPTPRPIGLTSPAPQPTLPVAGSAAQTAAVLLLGLVFLIGGSVYLVGKPAV